MRNKIILLLLLFSSTVFAQEDQKNKHVLSTVLFKLESNSQTFHFDLEPKVSYIDLEYERIFNRWSWSTNIGYGLARIKDDCRKCADHFSGIGYLQEYYLFTGVNYRITRKLISRFQFFIGTDLYYSYLNYSGNFGGGFSGKGIQRDDKNNSFGVRQRIGIHFYAVPRLRITLTTSSRLGYSWEKPINSSEFRQTIEISITAPELKVGYLF